MEAHGEALQAVLQAVGVWPWLRNQFPGMGESELLSAVDGDFETILDELERNRPQREAEGNFGTWKPLFGGVNPHE